MRVLGEIMFPLGCSHSTQVSLPHVAAFIYLLHKPAPSFLGGKITHPSPFLTRYEPDGNFKVCAKLALGFIP